MGKDNGFSQTVYTHNMADYEIRLDNARRLVWVTMSGNMEVDEGEQMVTAARTAAMEHHFNLLYDVRNVTVRAMFSDWYALARKLPVLKDIQAHHTLTAILHAPAEDEEQFRFYATTASNVGLSVRAFSVEQEAIDWLTGDGHGVE